MSINQQKKLNKILDDVENRIQAEVGALLGADFTLVGGERTLVSKEKAFDDLQGKQICAHMDITGEISGKGCLLLGIKDAIRLGGTLIMLPTAELKEVVGREEYSDEIEDSYGEIANIIAGSFTKDFEELFPKACRFIRKEQEIVVPAKVEIEGDSPVQNGTYYRVTSDMVLDGQPMGLMVMLLPAVTFELVEEQKQESSSVEPADEAAQQSVDEQSGTAEGPEDGAGKEPVDKKFNVVKHQKNINRLLAECRSRIEKEVSALLGSDITFGAPENCLLSKEEFFDDHVSGRQVLADMVVAGEGEGTSYLAMSVRDAIHLGGVLIMLPPTELQNVVSSEDFGVDARDAYGEIANIISGVYTAVFEEEYVQKLRFIRRDLHDIVPSKVEVASSEPIPDLTYYTSSMTMAAGEKQLGKMHMLFPAELLRLAGRKETHDTAGSRQHDPAQSAGQEETASPATSSSRDRSSAAASREDSKKQQKKVDKLFAACRDRMVSEVGALLGTEFKLSNPEHRLVTKEEFFFDEVSGKQVIANMDVVGEIEGQSYLSISLRDAIRIGGTLIMLPDAELDSVAAAEEFSEDTQDAFGEIANIIAGVFTPAFEEFFSQQVRFVKTELQQIAPMKVDIAASEPFPDQDYYLSQMDMAVGAHGLGKLNILFPAKMLGLDNLRAGVGDTVDTGEIANAGSAGAVAQRDSWQADSQSNGTMNSGPLDILVIGDDDGEVAKIAAALVQSGYTVKKISFKDDLHRFIPGKLKAIYLVMREVNEQSFGLAIKISSACSVPLIAAGPGWTRTKVIKAVKYGVRDILLTPASQEDIQENVENNLLELAA